MAKRSHKAATETVIENRRARHDYHILDTLECGIVLTGTEVKSLRDGQASLGEGFVRVEDDGESLVLHQVHIPEYPPAGPARQHEPARRRRLLAHAREIRKLRKQAEEKGLTIVPLKMYLTRGVAKLEIGVARGKKAHDKRRSIAERDMRRELDRESKVSGRIKL